MQDQNDTKTIKDNITGRASKAVFFTNIAEQKITLEDRLRSRGDDQTTQIKNRLKRFEKEMESKEYFDLHYVNENLEKTINLIEKDIKERV